MALMRSVDEQLAVIRRGVEQITPEAELRQKLERSLKTGQPLRVKYGIDPTGVDVHLGHTVPLRKLHQFQELGHKAVLILGTYTALVGDPSGRDQFRQGMSEEQVAANAKDYLKQVGKIIDISKTEVRTNGEWFAKYNFLDVMRLMKQITMQRMLERDDFTKRQKEAKPIYLSECLYPLMQGQDSVEIKADVELGGSEQLFNLMRGRDLQADAKQEPQICITLPILRGLDGAKRMGKSLGNYVGVDMPAYEQFAKTMSIPDELMKDWFDLLTDRPTEEIATLIDDGKTHPKAAKQTLAADIVRFYYGDSAATESQAEWEKRVSGGGDPKEIPSETIPATELKDGKIGVVKAMTLAKLAATNGEARRLIQQGGVTYGPDRTKITDIQQELDLPVILRVGQRKVVRLVPG
jgi:tyrosyl-tRNA synthetase